MSYSRVQYPGSGTTALFSVPFPFISKAYVEVRKDGIRLADGVGYTWQSANSILLSSGNLPTGAVLDIRRNTPKTVKLVDFQDGSVLTEAALDLAADQAFHLAQETSDDFSDLITIEPGGSYDALNRRVSNVASPEEATDAATKGYADSLVTYGAGNPIVADLAAASGAGMVGFSQASPYPEGSVGERLALSLPEVGSYSALRAYTGGETSLFVRGRSNVFDGASGTFAVDVTDTSSTDNDGTLLMDALGRRWKRIYSGGISPLWWGADRVGITDSTTAIQAALNLAESTVLTVIAGKVDMVSARVILPAGSYKTSAPLAVGEGVTFDGESSSTALIKPTHTGYAIKMGGNTREYSQVHVKNIGIVGKRTGTLSYGLWSSTTTVGIYAENCIRECSIEGNFITQCVKSIQTENSYAFEISKNYCVYATDYHIESDNAVNGWICGNRLDWAEKDGIYLNGTNSTDETIGVLIEANAVQLCWRNAIHLYDCSSASVVNNFFEGNYREAVDGSSHVYADVNIATGPNSRGYSFNVIGNFFTHGSAPDVDAYTAIRCNRAVSLVCTGNVCRDSYYWRFIDASSANVARIVALGNSYSGTFSKIVYDASVTVGIIEEMVNTGEVTIPQFGAGSLRVGINVTSSNATTNALATSHLISCAGGNRQLFLRDADCVPGRMYVAKKTDGGANQIIVTREAGSAKTVDGAVSVTSAAAYGVIRVISDGTNWFTC